MAQKVDDSTRQVVPRWRPFHVAVRHGQLEGGNAQQAPRLVTPKQGEIEDLIREFRVHRKPWHAADLLDAAFVLGQPELGAEAARFLVEEGASELTMSLARELLAVTTTTSGESAEDIPRELTARERYERIATLRRALRQVPTDPIGWIDLARDYSALGQITPAEKAVRVALGLAPHNRFVVRAASRFYLHTRDPERALTVVRRAAALREDPWLVAAEIVAASAADRRTRFAKEAEQMIVGGRFSPRHITELASALGTLEHQDGNRRKVRRLFEYALIDPTENTVAQAGWIARHMKADFAVPRGKLSVPRAFEAAAWDAGISGDFDEAAKQSWDWLRDEPFATRGAFFGSWVTSTAVGDHKASLRFSEAALLANPDDPRLIAQMIYDHTLLGNADKGSELLADLPRALQQHPQTEPSTEWEVLMEADRGLIAYRRGHIAEGRAHYEKALEIATQAGHRETLAIAALNFAFEEARVGFGAEWVPIIPTLLNVFPSRERAVYEAFARRIPVVTLS